MALAWLIITRNREPRMAMPDSVDHRKARPYLDGEMDKPTIWPPVGVDISLKRLTERRFRSHWETTTDVRGDEPQFK